MYLYIYVCVCACVCNVMLHVINSEKFLQKHEFHGFDSLAGI